MKITDFKVGEVFHTDTGKWCCTDIGNRVIVAIHLNQKDPRNYNGPPYSIPEHVFDENDMPHCRTDSPEADKDISAILKTKIFGEIHDAYMFTSAGGYGENTATLDKQTGKIYYYSDYYDDEDEENTLAEEDYDSRIHIQVPHKNDLDLGRELVYDFVEEFIPEEGDKISQIFRKRGAYSRFKDFLDSKELLQEWYDFELKRQQTALYQWCLENEVDIMHLESQR